MKSIKTYILNIVYKINESLRTYILEYKSNTNERLCYTKRKQLCTRREIIYKEYELNKLKYTVLKWPKNFILKLILFNPSYYYIDRLFIA